MRLASHVERQYTKLRAFFVMGVYVSQVLYFARIKYRRILQWTSSGPSTEDWAFWREVLRFSSGILEIGFALVWFGGVGGNGERSGGGRGGWIGILFWKASGGRQWLTVCWTWGYARATFSTTKRRETQYSPQNRCSFFKVAYRMSRGPHGQQVHGRFDFGVYEYSLSLSFLSMVLPGKQKLWGGLAGG